MDQQPRPTAEQPGWCQCWGPSLSWESWAEGDVNRYPHPVRPPNWDPKSTFGLGDLGKPIANQKSDAESVEILKQLSEMRAVPAGTLQVPAGTQVAARHFPRALRVLQGAHSSCRHCRRMQAGRESRLAATWLLTCPGHCCAQEDAGKGISEHWESLRTKQQGIRISQLHQVRHPLQLGQCQKSFSRAASSERCLVLRDQALEVLHKTFKSSAN